MNPGDLIAPGYSPNYGQRKQASWVYLTGTLDAAIWGAELAVCDGRGRVYVVEPTGAIEGDPNLTGRNSASRSGSRARSRAGRGARLSGRHDAQRLATAATKARAAG